MWGESGKEIVNVGWPRQRKAPGYGATEHGGCSIGKGKDEGEMQWRL